ncbi:hypothetical protein LWI29_028718 [Acer saccharum]|uniref:Uncharacterized protein n=1 Tax=Acer saccharum TaxID=4024 RepID=A0AA39TXD7_ACESA|nr:hypothetical protein LWI29_028718 [Acer saccharum]
MKSTGLDPTAVLGKDGSRERKQKVVEDSGQSVMKQLGAELADEMEGIEEVAEAEVEGELEMNLTRDNEVIPHT